MNSGYCRTTPDLTEQSQNTKKAALCAACWELFVFIRCVNHCEVGALPCDLAAAGDAGLVVAGLAGFVAAPLVLGLVAAGLAGAGTPDCRL